MSLAKYGHILIFALSLTGCGLSTSTDLMLTLKIQGSFVAPATYHGSFEPISQTFELQKIILTEAAGSQTELYTEDPVSFSVIDRPLKIFEMPIDESWSGITMQDFTVQFSSTVTGKSLYKDDHELTLPSDYPLEDTPTYGTTTSVSAGVFTAEVGKALSFVIYSDWKSTVSRDESIDPPIDTMENPDLSITLLERD